MGTKKNVVENFNVGTTKNGTIKIFEIGSANLIKGVKSSKSIYKKEIFADCKSDQDKKHLRLKLRKQLKAYIASAFTYEKMKQNDKLEALKKNWHEYSKLVYTNTEIIIDGNANEEFAEDCKRFLQTMNK